VRIAQGYQLLKGRYLKDVVESKVVDKKLSDEVSDEDVSFHYITF
jgi:hypothetical protein